MTGSDESRIHVLKAVIHFVIVEDGGTTGEERTLTFDLDVPPERRVGSIYFGPDALRAQGFVDPSRVHEIPVENYARAVREESIEGVELGTTGKRVEARSARRLCWHEEMTCKWYCMR